MIRIHVVVEGPTEESFVKSVLAEAFWPRQIFLTPIILGRPGHKGGRTDYARVKKDVMTQLKQDHSAYCSTMLDFYGIGKGFPGMSPSANLPSRDKVKQIEQEVKADICAAIPDLRCDVRFVPYLQLHEFEGLLFSNPQTFASAIGKPHLAGDFERIRRGFATPEDINDDPNTAPSRRVLEAYPAYSKVLDGTRAARAVGIDRMKQECLHFREWMERLEALAED